MIKKVFITTVLLFVLTLQVCATEITILHTSDIHGRNFTIQCAETKTCGGVSKRITLFKNTRQTNKNTLIFDVGDYYQGSVLDTLYRQKYSPEYMRLAHYDIATFGNHEFDKGIKILKKYLQKSKTEYISTNLKFDDNYFIKNVKPYKIFDVEGKKILVLGIVTPKCASLTNLKGAEILDTKKSLTKYIKQIPHDKVILLSHSGILYDRQIAQNVAGIDIILGGHDHIFTQEKVNNTWIFHTGEFGIKVNKITYDIYTGSIKQNYITLDDKISSDIDAEKSLEILNKKTKSLHKTLFYLPEELDGTNAMFSSQTNLGQLVLKSFVDYFNNDFDIALINSGAIRSGRKLVGNISVADTYEMLPFHNKVVKFSIDGKTLKLILAKGKITGKSYLQVYSKIDTANIDEKKFYKVISLDFLYNGGDGYFEFKNAKLEQISKKYYRDIFVEYMSKTLQNSK